MTPPALSSQPLHTRTSTATQCEVIENIKDFDGARWHALQGVQVDHPWQTLPNHIHRTSEERPWQGLRVWHQVGPIEDLYIPAQSNCILLLRRGNNADMTVRIGDALARTPWQTGEVFIVPSNLPTFWRSSVVRDNLHISLSPAWLQRAAGCDVRLAPCFARRDPVLMAFANLLLASLDNNVSLQPEFAEHMAMSIALHLVKNYAQPNDRPRSTAGLSSRQMRDLADAVLQGLHEPWPVPRLAHIAGLSPFHFSRAFKHSFGKSPHAWVHFQRMELAAKLVRDSALPLSEIAVATGHPSAAHFSHAFRRHWGITPSDYRRG